ncbi:MAG TPA: fucose isomerase [Planctomycetota bacterium]|jgi:L-fucose isomerase-like protein
MPNSPVVKLAVVGVSRDCFPIELVKRRMAKLMSACRKAGVRPYACNTIVATDADVPKAIAELQKAGINAAVIYLGNFGPEGPLTVFAQRFGGPVMACAAAEETAEDLIGGRGDAYCGLLNASYNFGLRGVKVYIPQKPVGLPEELIPSIKHFETVAKIQLGLKGLKIFAFGPRPHDFYACNAPIQPLYDLGVEVVENSELDLLQLYKKVDEKDKRVPSIVRSMAKELGGGNQYPDLLPKLARFEIALTRFAEENLGSRQFAIFADKCWPAFEPAFGFVPCYVNSRLSAKGMPVSCEVDIYGTLSEYIAMLASDQPVTLLDINNTVPNDLISDSEDLKGATREDLFMGFHCGNSPACCMKGCCMKYQLIMRRLMEPEAPKPDITRGTLEGQLKPGPATFFRLQGSADGKLHSYIAPGNILDVDPKSFGGIGVFAIPNFARFYRHVLVGQRFPHHGAVAFTHCGKALFDGVKMLGVKDISVPLPATMPYAGENLFELM